MEANGEVTGGKRTETVRTGQSRRRWRRISENDHSRPFSHPLILIRRLKNVADVNRSRIPIKRVFSENFRGGNVMENVPLDKRTTIFLGKLQHIFTKKATMVSFKIDLA